MKTLIAIPIFNEAGYIPAVLQRIKEIGCDVLAIDDGSTDETPRLLAADPDVAVITHPENRGYGQSLIDAFNYASVHDYDWLITIDCDDQHEPEFIPMFLERAARGDIDVISGSRYLKTLPGNTEAPDDRRSINQRITQMINRELGLSLTDSFCGFKAYRVEALEKLTLTIPGYAFPMQFWVQAHHHGLRITELPVALIYNDPNRHFGGMLDNPEAREQHYLDVFDCERQRVNAVRRVGAKQSPCMSLDES